MKRSLKSGFSILTLIEPKRVPKVSWFRLTKNWPLCIMVNFQLMLANYPTLIPLFFTEKGPTCKGINCLDDGRQLTFRLRTHIVSYVSN